MSISSVHPPGWRFEAVALADHLSCSQRTREVLREADLLLSDRCGALGAYAVIYGLSSVRLSALQRTANALAGQVTGEDTWRDFAASALSLLCSEAAERLEGGAPIGDGKRRRSISRWRTARTSGIFVPEGDR